MVPVILLQIAPIAATQIPLNSLIWPILNVIVATIPVTLKMYAHLATVWE